MRVQLSFGLSLNCKSANQFGTATEVVGARVYHVWGASFFLHSDIPHGYRKPDKTVARDVRVSRRWPICGRVPAVLPVEPNNERDPNFYVIRRHRLGAGLLNLARRSLDVGALPPTRAAQTPV
jgi:hypothetical protein